MSTKFSPRTHSGTHSPPRPLHEGSLNNLGHRRNPPPGTFFTDSDCGKVFFFCFLTPIVFLTPMFFFVFLLLIWYCMIYERATGGGSTIPEGSVAPPSSGGIPLLPLRCGPAPPRHRQWMHPPSPFHPAFSGGLSGDAGVEGGSPTNGRIPRTVRTFPLPGGGHGIPAGGAQSGHLLKRDAVGRQAAWFLSSAEGGGMHVRRGGE